MMVRELPPREFCRLDAIDWLQPESRPVPGICRVVVAEEKGKIVGFWIIQTRVLIEPVWIDPAMRKGFIAKRMFDRVHRILKDIGRGVYMTHAASEEHAGYLERLGLRRQDWIPFLGRVE